MSILLPLTFRVVHYVYLVLLKSESHVTFSHHYSVSLNKSQMELLTFYIQT